MKIRLGYVAISQALEETTSTTYPVTRFEKEKNWKKLEEVIISNLEALIHILIYNQKNNIHFYRISSNLIPFATYDKIKFDYITPYQKYYQKIGRIIKENKIRTDFHPNQYCVLNSTKKEVIDHSIKILEYHYQLLKEMKIEEKIIILHIGSSTFGKKNSLSRFLHTFDQLPKYLQDIIAIENDDKVFTIDDCLILSRKRGIPIVLDYHHFYCNPGELEIHSYLEEVFSTWKNKNLPPKIHFSSPKNKKEYRSHHDFINSDSFISFLNILKNYPNDVDIMLEAKAKDDALFRLVRELKYKQNYHFLDETTFLLK